MYRHSTYRPDIDGLRAVAISGVLLFHIFTGLMPGGFVGVDVFFVISGFLITSIIVNPITESRFSYLDFYGRRIRRLFPALITVLGCSLVYGWLPHLSNEIVRLGRQAASGTLFVVNWI